MNIFVDTSVWSLALRRSSGSGPEVKLLERSLTGGDIIITTGLVLQELLQGFQGPKSRDRIVHSFSLLPVITPDIEDHIEAAGLRNTCRRKGVQVGTIDALIAQLCIRNSLQLLTTDEDLKHMAAHTPLSLLTA